jgi:hypothetical protein
VLEIKSSWIEVELKFVARFSVEFVGSYGADFDAEGFR